MPINRTAAILAALLIASACSAAPDAVPVRADGAAAPAAMHYKAVLVAGDDGLPVFDNAVEGVATRLRQRGAAMPGALQRLSTTRRSITAGGAGTHNGVRSASLGHVLDAIRAMHPDAGEGCFVFATSHGAPDRGLALTATDEFLDPGTLDRALLSGCGEAPTVVIVSGCFTGNFTGTPMARANRVVLAAARADRPSFGCGAGRVYTVYDQCLLNALDRGGTWQQAFGSVRRCVATEERRGRFEPSEPQAYFGPAVASLRLPAAAPPGHGPDSSLMVHPSFYTDGPSH